MVVEQTSVQGISSQIGAEAKSEPENSSSRTFASLKHDISSRVRRLVDFYKSLVANILKKAKTGDSESQKMFALDITVSNNLYKSFSWSNLTSVDSYESDEGYARTNPSSPSTPGSPKDFLSHHRSNSDLSAVRFNATKSRSCFDLASPSPSLDLAMPRTARSNSSDSAVVMPGEETIRIAQLKAKASGEQSLQIDAGKFNAAPSVVISDFSTFEPVESPDSDPYSSDNALSLEEFGNQWRLSMTRKLSDCSTCSLASSTLSLDEDFETQNNVDDQANNRISGWRKVRNIVHWSPFIQTYKNQQYQWVQLSGHQGSFKPGDHGTILKKFCPKEEKCLQALCKDMLRPYVPDYKGQVTNDDGEKFIRLQDLLGDYENPCVMDCKLGVRTYLEEELAKAKEKPKLRKDMYEKMIQVDPNAPTPEENLVKGVTKPRYMVWRETISSTATLGFRIEGMKKGNGKSSKDFKTTKTKDQVLSAFRDFLNGYTGTAAKYVQRLKAIRATLDVSEFFHNYELIGSSLLFVHNYQKANVWLIDFAKSHHLPEGVHIDHRTPWVVGSHEDGYLIGLENLIDLFEILAAEETHHE